LLSCSLLLPGCDGKNQKTGSTTEDDYTVGFLMETDDLDRWKRDESFFGDKSRSLGMTVLRAVADADQDRQNKQGETLLAQGVNVLVVVPD
jgi:D-xylose transport system substrate-binding protein